MTWRRDCAIAAARRGRQVLIPHGNTVLKPGDVLVAVTEGEAGKALRDVCTAQEKPE